MNNVPRAVLASSQFLSRGADFALHGTHILCRSLTNTSIIYRLLLKHMTNSRGPGGDTDNYTGAKFRINTSLIVRTSIRRIESAPPSYLMPENMHFNT